MLRTPECLVHPAALLASSISWIRNHNKKGDINLKYGIWIKILPCRKEVNLLANFPVINKNNLTFWCIFGWIPLLFTIIWGDLAAVWSPRFNMFSNTFRGSVRMMIYGHCCRGFLVFDFFLTQKNFWQQPACDCWFLAFFRKLPPTWHFCWVDKQLKNQTKTKQHASGDTFCNFSTLKGKGSSSASNLAKIFVRDFIWISAKRKHKSSATSTNSYGWFKGFLIIRNWWSMCWWVDGYG